MRTWPVLALLLLGCTSGNESENTNVGGDAGTSTIAAADRCRVSCEVVARCQGFPLSGCAGDIYCNGWPGEAWRPEVAKAYLACERTCPSDSSTCVEAAFEAAGGARSVDTAYAQACAEAMSACDLPNDTCGAEQLYEEAAVVSAMACLDMQCASIGFCVDDCFR